MAFGTASLGISIPDLPATAPAGPARAARTGKTCRGTSYDCGKHGQLTVTEIAHLVGASRPGIYKRGNAGVRGGSLCTPVPGRTEGHPCGTTYDCGKHGWLTAKQIARIAGTSKTAIYKRIKTGATGEALCVRRWANQSKIRRDAPPRRHSLVM